MGLFLDTVCMSKSDLLVPHESTIVLHPATASVAQSGTGLPLFVLPVLRTIPTTFIYINNLKGPCLFAFGLGRASLSNFLSLHVNYRIALMTPIANLHHHCTRPRLIIYPKNSRTLPGNAKELSLEYGTLSLDIIGSYIFYRLQHHTWHNV
jgi:hypothetical protein